MVMFYDGSSCPAGWSELTAARGRYLVGLPSGGTLDGTSGTALSNLEARAVGLHSHTATDSGHSHTATDSGHSHTATDAGHSHTATDSGHTHSITDPGHTHQVRDGGSGGPNVSLVDAFGTSGYSLQNGGVEPNTTGITGTNSGTANITVGTGAASITVGAGTANITVGSGAANITVVNAGSVAGTNAPYLQLLACKKS
jgi:hypothetical protein